MEELTSKLACSFEFSGPNNPAAAHPRFSAFKNIGERSVESSQEKRRKHLLEEQKKRRFDYVNHVRRLVEDDWKDVDEKDEEDSIEMECEMPRIRKPPRRYKNQLMLSEWLVEVPPDLVDEWLLVLCPAGRRNLIVAAKGVTKAYNKAGSCLNTFSSLIPGGNKRYSSDHTLLDCIYCENDKTFYILDMMCWKKQPIFETETDFRFYWVQTKLEEIPDLKTIGISNPYKFIVLPNYSCTSESIVQALEAPKVFSYELDGLLFYHKRSHYTHGPTPLVGWLKVFMLPEILNIPIPPNYVEKCPKNYTTMQEHIKSYEIKRERKENRKNIIRKSCFRAPKTNEPMLTETEGEKPGISNTTINGAESSNTTNGLESMLIDTKCGGKEHLLTDTEREKPGTSNISINDAESSNTTNGSESMLMDTKCGEKELL